MLVYRQLFLYIHVYMCKFLNNDHFKTSFVKINEKNYRDIIFVTAHQCVLYVHVYQVQRTFLFYAIYMYMYIA